ncbi:MAG: aminoglycoside phosphotransferase family protein [Clostridia bacterium]|nr:aminoglycoside phosphotransferase family protein [Clostridia bacterium]
MDFNVIKEKFALAGELTEAAPYGFGHINSTFLLSVTNGGKKTRYILQRINNSIFRDVDGLMNNIKYVTEHIRKKNEGDPDVDRCTLTVIPAADGKLYYEDGEGNYLRLYLFVEDTVALQQVENPEQLKTLGAAFGNFQNQLADFDASKLIETIPNFHNTADRYRLFEEAVKNDLKGRAASVKEEIEFVRARKADTELLLGLLKEGKLPLRVTHNDTKLNNLLFDDTDLRAVCVIDLDTVMPGLVHYDFGDSIRFGASTGAEDEKDLSKIEMSLELFEKYTEGFMSACGSKLNDCEIEYLPFSAKLMTFECGIRFLTDYLNGDTYFKIHYPEQNLDRTHTQFKLVYDMECKMDAMKAIVAKYR